MKSVSCLSRFRGPKERTWGQTHPMIFCLWSSVKEIPCRRKQLWFGDKDITLDYAPKSYEMVLTVHRWFANKFGQLAVCKARWDVL